jgi:protocatechuate 3,4-dioxygenase beta subunit
MANVRVSAVPFETPFEEARRAARRASPPKPVASATTGADGSFLLTVAPDPQALPRGFRLMFEGGGIAPVLTAGVYDAGESEDLGDFPVPRAARIAGRVVDDKGAPIAGAEVQLVPGGTGGPFSAAPDLVPVPRVALTGADGAFRFDEAAPNGNRLTIEVRGYATTELTGIREGAVPRPIALAPGLSLAGSVKQSDRKSAAAGALVRFEGKARTRWTETRPDGSFRLSELPSGTGVLVVDAGDAGVAEVRGVALPLADARPLQAVLAPAAAIEGRVIDAKTGTALARVKVLVRSGASVAVARSAADGRYRVAGLFPGRYRVDADDPRYVPYERSGISVLAGEAQKVDLPLTLGATISGRVVDESGAPIAGARGRLSIGGEGELVAFLRQERRGADRSGFRSGADGSFKATRLAPGDNQRLNVTHPEYEAKTVPGISLAAGATRSGVVVVLQRGLSLAGVVKDQDGKPVPGAEVNLNQERTFQAGRGGIQARFSVGGGPESRPRATSGPDGRFEFRGLSAGDYGVSARKAGYSDAVAAQVKVAYGVEPVELVLEPGAAISGMVVDPSGQPAEGYFVQVRTRGETMGGPPRGGPREPTGPDGFFHIDGLTAGNPYELIVLGPDGPGPRKEGVTAPADGIELVVPGRGRISGRVVDAQSGGPVSDFEISVNPDRSGRGGGGMVVRMVGPGGGRRRGSGQNEQIHSDDGSFVLEDIGPGTWEVNVEAKGYQAARVGGISVEGGRTKDGVEVRMTHGSAIRGRVVDGRSGRPVPNARVSAEPAGGGPRPPMLALFGEEGGIVTDADGLFEIDGLTPGRYLVEARHAEYSEASSVVEVKEGLAATELRMHAGGALGGTVLAETRRPLSGARVALSPAGDGGRGPLRMLMGDDQVAVSDENGRFRFDHLNAGRYRVTAMLRDRSTPPVDVALQPNEARDDLVLTLNAGATIRGIVSGLPQAARAGVNVTANAPDFFSMTRTAADGSFELSGVPAGPVTLRAQTGDFLGGGSLRTASAQVNVPEGQLEVAAEIVFEVGFTLSGRVTRGSEPVPDAMVNAVQRGLGRTSAARTDAAGFYQLEGLPEGVYNVNVQGGGARAQEVTVSGDATLDLVIPVARIAGIVVDATTKQPLADAVVQAEAPGASGTSVSVVIGPGGGGMMMGRGATTDSTGRFVLEDLEPQTYSLTVRKAGFEFEKRDVIAAEQGADSLVLELRRGEGIGIVVQDGVFGVPLRSVTARVFDAQGSSVFGGPIALDSEGRGEIPSLKAGTYNVLIGSGGYAPAMLERVIAPMPQLPVALTPGGTVEIRAGGATLPSGGTVGVTFLDAQNKPYPLTVFSTSGKLTLRSPQQRVENFRPGSYTLAVDGASGTRRTFAVTEGGVTVVELP